MMQGAHRGHADAAEAQGTTMTRLRFSTTCVHRYEVKTAIRDAAVGYFAGVREVIPMVTTHINEQDPEVLELHPLRPHPVVMSNVKALDSGPGDHAEQALRNRQPVLRPGHRRLDPGPRRVDMESSIAHDHWAPGSSHGHR